MCGICGFTNPDEQVNSIIENMCESIKHRGPDGEGQYVDDGVALGHTRLSLIDHAGGKQPMHYDLAKQAPETRTVQHTIGGNEYVIVFNGEIYNYLELKPELINLGYQFNTDSDTEVLLVAYLAWGKDSLVKLRGMFAFAVWNVQTHELFCARDFFGIKPFYYTMSNGQFIFASEIKAILEHPSVTKTLNEKALEEYLSFQYSVLEETFFKGIYKLLPAHCLTLKKGEEPVVERYWKVDYAIQEERTSEKTAQDIEDTMKDSVIHHRIADVEVGSFLSSGVDSNYLTALLSKQSEEGQLKAFTVGFETADGNKYNEITYAKEASEHLGIEHHTHSIDENEFWDSLAKVQWHMDEPSADPAAVALYAVDHLASQHVKAVLSGEGADELFGGYGIYQTPIQNERLNKYPRPLLKAAGALMKTFGIRGANYINRALTPLPDQFIGNAFIFKPEERKQLLKNPASDTTPFELTKPFYEQVSNLDEVTQMQYIDMNFWLVGDILLKTDKMAMAHSLESRVPFLDLEVWKVARTLPTHQKVTLETTKDALRRAASKTLPEQFCTKKKLGFPVPLRVWLREEKYYNIVKDAFNSATAQKYFNTQELESLLQQHFEGAADNSRKVWTIFSFLMWHRVYFEDENPAEIKLSQL